MINDHVHVTNTNLPTLRNLQSESDGNFNGILHLIYLEYLQPHLIDSV